MGLSASYVAASDADLAALEMLDPDTAGDEAFEILGRWYAENPTAEIGTSWHGLHYVLTGLADSTSRAGVPLSEAVLGCWESGAGTDGYATAVASRDVPRLLAALRAVDREALVDAFDPGQLAAHDIYPAIIWLRDRPKTLVLGLLDALDTLTAFWEATSARGLGALVRVS